MTLAGSLLVVLLFGFGRPLLPDASNLLFDWYQRLDPRPWDDASPVRVVDIDDESLARVGQWPWPRSRIAEILERLAGLDAATVAIDIVFAEPDASSPERMIALLPPSPGRTLLAQEIGKAETNDGGLAKAMAQVPTVLGAILTHGPAPPDYPAKFGIATAGDDPHPFLARFTGAAAPLPVLTASAAGVGALNWLPDRDQVVRRVPLMLALGDRLVPSVAAETLRVAQGASTIIVRSSNASGHSAFGAQTGVNAIKIGDLEIPTGAMADVRLRATVSDPRRPIAAWKVLAGEIERDAVAGRIIMLGTSAAGLGDRRATPVEPSVPGVEIQAQVLAQILAGDRLLRPDWAPGAELALALLLGLAVGAGALRVSAPTGAIATAATLGVLLWGSRHLFATQGLLLDPILPGVSASLAYVCCVAWLYQHEQLLRRRVREAFGRYVSPAVVARIAEDPGRLALGGETRSLTVMFCDIRGFTATAERMDAQSLTHFINDYLSAMTKAVLARQGTIDKYIGDAVMAFWNAPLDDPDHAGNAARAALDVAGALETLNRNGWPRAEGRNEPDRDVAFGIGLATGDCCVGNFGSLHRFDYSALGDAVNLAARLEAATKYYRVDILAAQATCDLCGDLAWLEVDTVRVKGKNEIVRIYTLAGDEAEKRNASFVALSDIHARMLTAYRSGDFTATASHAREALAICPARLSDFYGSFAARCEVLARSRPDAWRAVTDLGSL